MCSCTNWYLTHTHAHTPPLSSPPSLSFTHFSTLAGLGTLSLGCPTHKETLGDRISRLTGDSHMSSSSNWYSKLYTFKCHQERAKPTSAFLCIGSTFMRRALSLGQQWGREYTFLLFYQGDLIGEAPSRVWDRLYYLGLKWVGGWLDGRIDRQVDGWRDAEVVVRRRVLQLLPCVIVGDPFLHSISTKKIWSRLFRVERALSAAQYRQYWFNLTYSSNSLIQQHR